MPLRAGERDALGTALLASILFHVLLLQAIPAWRQLERLSDPTPLSARLQPLRPPPAHPDEPSKPAKGHRPSTPGPKAAAAKRAPPVEFVREESPTQAVATPEAAEAAVVASHPVAPSRAESPAPAPPTSPALDGATVAQYRLAVISLAREFNRYPRLAIENDWQGRVEVRLNVGAEGAVAAPRLHKSSGHEILDRQALEMIGRAARGVPLPVALRGREFAIDVPVIFDLRDAAR